MCKNPTCANPYNWIQSPKRSKICTLVQGAWRFGGKNVKLCIFAFAKVKNQEITKVQNNYQIHKQTIYENLYMIETKLICILKFVNLSENSLIHAIFCIQNVKQQNLNPSTTQNWMRAHFCCLTLHGVSFVRLQLNQGTIHLNCSIKMCNPFYFNENNTLIIN